ncbi:hypothetical protein B0H16DRAFT_1787461 [Mycena metata]|uniref:Uncharacterized protein n=1 Tax=Mycena metata TaxID=1033252 RepID=A0AAD7NMX6_9AGAR|nr:hypothetical protein B0H16DRAFT_1787461 [Mycena metata]
MCFGGGDCGPLDARNRYSPAFVWPPVHTVLRCGRPLAFRLGSYTSLCFALASFAPLQSLCFHLRSSPAGSHVLVSRLASSVALDSIPAWYASLTHVAGDFYVSKGLLKRYVGASAFAQDAGTPLENTANTAPYTAMAASPSTPNATDPDIPLYAADELIGGVHGRNRLAGSSLLEAVVFGRIAGAGAGAAA